MCAYAAVNSVSGMAAVRADKLTVLAGVRPMQHVFWSGSVWDRAATLSAAAALSLLVLRRPRCRSFVASLCRTDALLFLPSATGFFMPAACGGVEYPWEFWTTLVPVVVGAVVIVTLLARHDRFAFRADARRRVRGFSSAVRLPTLAVLQVIALCTVLCAVPLHLCTRETPGVVPLPTAPDVGSWTLMLALLSVAAAAAFVATAVLRWVAQTTLMMSACSIRIWLRLGVVAVASLPCLHNNDELSAGLAALTPAVFGRVLAAAGSRAWLATAQPLVFAASPFLCPAKSGTYVLSSHGIPARLAPPGGSSLFGGFSNLLKASCTCSLRWVRVVVTVLSAVALLSSISINLLAYPRLTTYVLSNDS